MSDPKKTAELCKARWRIAELERQLAEANSIIDGVYELVFVNKPESPAQAEWRKNWLAKAKEHGAGFDA